MAKSSVVKVLQQECEKHGVYLAYSYGGKITRCAACAIVERSSSSDHSPILFEPTGTDNVPHEKCMRCSGVPERFLNSCFSNYHPKCDEASKVRAILKRFISSFEIARTETSNLILLGSSGTGKTHLAVAMISCLVKQGHEVRYIDSRKQLSAGFKSNQTDLVVIDNLGTNLSFHNISEIRNLLMDRYDLKLPSILVSRVDRGTIEKILGVDVLDRMREGCSKIISFQWESYRSSSLNPSNTR